MIEYTKETGEVKVTGKDNLICPVCFKPLPGCTVFGARADEYGRVLRNYMGWCIHCGIGFEVVQFLNDDHWALHQYRYYAAVLPPDKPTPSPGWRILKALPETAPVVVGEGGEYNLPYEPKTVELTKQLLNALKATTVTVECLLKMMIPGRKN
jgi:hypothetical protein